MKIKFLFLSLFFLLHSGIAFSADTATYRQFDFSDSLTDGTPVSVTVVAPASGESSVNASVRAAISNINSLDRDFFSEAGVQAKLNSLRSGQKLELSPSSFALVKDGLNLSAITGGWFDITAPSPKSYFVQRDWRRVEINEGSRTVGVKSDDIRFDLRRFALAYFVDMATRELANSGLSNSMVRVGPIERNQGRDIFTPWALQIGFGCGTNESFACRAFNYNVSDVAAATITPEGLGQSLIDARSRKEVPSGLTKSVTVLAGNAETALAYAVVAYTLGPKYGRKFVMSHAEIKGIIVDADGNFFASAGFDKANTKGEPAGIASESNIDRGPNDLKQKQIEEERDQ